MTMEGRIAKRRQLLMFAGASALSPAFAIAATEPKHVIWLGPQPKGQERIRQAFKARGLVDGRDLKLTFLDLPTNNEKEGDELAESVIRSRPDIIVLIAHATLWMLQKRTRDIPVVFYNLGSDPALVGLVKSLARPGGNLTGSTLGFEDLWLKNWQLLKELMPSLKRAGALVDKRTFEELERPDHPFALQWERGRRLKEFAEQQLGIKIVELRVPKNATVDDVARIVGSSGVEAAYLDPYTTDVAAKFLLSAKIPAMCLGNFGVKNGFVLGAGWDWMEGENYAVDVTQRLLRGESPAVIPVYQIKKWDIFLNRRRARELGLMIPESMVLLAKEVYD